MPLSHPPGHAQCDFGQAWAFMDIGGKKRRVHYFGCRCLQRRHIHKGISRGDHWRRSGRSSCPRSLPGGVPQRFVPVRQLELAVAKILGGGRRQAHEHVHGVAVALPVQLTVFGRVGKSNDKGSVEGMVGYGRRNFLVPIPRAENFA